MIDEDYISLKIEPLFFNTAFKPFHQIIKPYSHTFPANTHPIYPDNFATKCGITSRASYHHHNVNYPGCTILYKPLVTGRFVAMFLSVPITGRGLVNQHINGRDNHRARQIVSRNSRGRRL